MIHNGCVLPDSGLCGGENNEENRDRIALIFESPNLSPIRC